MGGAQWVASRGALRWLRRGWRSVGCVAPRRNKKGRVAVDIPVSLIRLSRALPICLIRASAANVRRGATDTPDGGILVTDWGKRRLAASCKGRVDVDFPVTTHSPFSRAPICLIRASAANVRRGATDSPDGGILVVQWVASLRDATNKCVEQSTHPRPCINRSLHLQ